MQLAGLIIYLFSISIPLNDIVLANYFLLRALNSFFLRGDMINAALVKSFGKDRRLPCAKSP
jgi:hypothetical protein